MGNYVHGLIYGRPKTGKTLSFIRAFPTGFFVAPPGGLTCAQHLGLDPDGLAIKEFGKHEGAISTFVEMEAYVTAAAKSKKNYPAIIFDDMSLICDVIINDLAEEHDGWTKNRVFNYQLFHFLDHCREQPIHVFTNWHLQEPREVRRSDKQVKGSRSIPGTIAVQGWQMPEKTPAKVDFVARVDYSEEYGGWPYIFTTSPDEEFIAGSRIDVPAEFPMNLGELLREAGHEIPRHPDMPWMEEEVERIANEILDGGDIQEVSRDAVKRLTGKAKSDKHIIWAIEDALGRVNLKKHRRGTVDRFLDSLADRA